jgi:hypothetical protein
MRAGHPSTRSPGGTAPRSRRAIRPPGQNQVAHRARLPRVENRSWPGALRRPHLCRMAPPHDSRDRRPPLHHPAAADPLTSSWVQAESLRHPQRAPTSPRRLSRILPPLPTTSTNLTKYDKDAIDHEVSRKSFMQRAVKKTTAFVATAAVIGSSSLFMATPANAVPDSRTDGAILLAGNTCELKLTTRFTADRIDCSRVSWRGAARFR